MRIDVGACSDAGRKNTHNEDSYRVVREMGLFVVSDGIGGQAKGEAASEITVEAVTKHCSQTDSAAPSAIRELRPGLSATAKITTARRPNALTLPIQALVERDPAVEKALAANAGKPAPLNTAAPADPAKTHLLQGVFVLKGDAHGKLRTQFVPVTTGVTGSTDIELLKGLSPGDEIVTGRYKVLRTLGSGVAVKRDNSPEITTATGS